MEQISIIAFLIFLTSQNIFSQTRNIVLRIDTIETCDYKETIWSFRVTVSNQGFLNFGESFDSTRHLTYNGIPNYINTLLLKSDSANIKIPIDPFGSYIQFNNISKLNDFDTIRISRLELFDCRISDTSFMTKKYF